MITKAEANQKNKNNKKIKGREKEWEECPNTHQPMEIEAFV